MSKRKMAQFKLKKDETLLKKGMVDYCIAGSYGHAAMGDGYLTDTRFYFEAKMPSGELITLDIPLNDINTVSKTGIPFLTRSILIIADGRPYRFNAFIPGRWTRAIKKAVQNMQNGSTL